MNSINQASISVIFYHKLKIFHTVLTIKHRFKRIFFFFHVNSKNGLCSCIFSLVSGYLTVVLLSMFINRKCNLHMLWKRYCLVCPPSLDLNFCVLLTTHPTPATVISFVDRDSLEDVCTWVGFTGSWVLS